MENDLDDILANFGYSSDENQFKEKDDDNDNEHTCGTGAEDNAEENLLRSLETGNGCEREPNTTSENDDDDNDDNDGGEEEDDDEDDDDEDLNPLWRGFPTRELTGDPNEVLDQNMALQEVIKSELTKLRERTQENMKMQRNLASVLRQGTKVKVSGRHRSFSFFPSFYKDVNMLTNRHKSTLLKSFNLCPFSQGTREKR